MKVAFVSGASRGIGRAIAESLAKAGYHMALCCEKNIALLEQTAKDWQEKYFVEIMTFKGDIADEAFVSEMCMSVLRHFGQIDVVINNAGISHVGLLCDMTGSQWQRILDVNLSSVFFTTKGFLPTMIQQKSGHILTISSMWGTRGASCEVAYSATKGGLHSFTKALAKEVAPCHIAVNAIACGLVDTDMNTSFSKKELEDICEEIPANRMASPEEIAATVVSLLSAPSYMTGQIIGVDGGFF